MIPKSLRLRPPDSAKIISATASLYNWLERRGTDPVLREWIQLVRRTREVLRTEDVMSGITGNVDMEACDEESGQDARNKALQYLVECSDREFEHWL